MKYLQLFLVYIFKGLIFLVPKRLTNWVKSFSFLLKFYKKLILRAGLTGSIVKWQKEHIHYKNIVIQQNKLLNSFDYNHLLLNVVIWVHEIKNLNLTINSIIKAAVSNIEITLLIEKKDYIKWKDILISYDLKIVLLNDVKSIQCVFESSTLNIRAGDQLHPYTIKYYSHFINHSEFDFIYSDSDVIDSSDENLERHNPSFYPDWNPDLHLSTGYIQTGVFLQKNFFVGIEDLKLRSISELLTLLYLTKKSNLKVKHIDLVLVSVTNIDRTAWLPEKEITCDKFISELDNNIAKIKWNISFEPLVSLIIPTKNSYELVKACIDSILTKTTYQNYEIILVDNNSDDEVALSYFKHISEHPKIRVIHYPYVFNYSAINNYAVKEAKGKIIGLINNDIEVISSDWLDYMVRHVEREDVGCVGAKLLYENGLVQHAGVVLGYGGGAGHAHKYFNKYESGYLNRLKASNNYSAVTAACLIVQKEDYIKVNGLNETDLTVAFNDVDFCLKILEQGRINLYCAEAVLFHHESISRGLDTTPEKRKRFESELDFLQKQWEVYINNDPAYNINLTLKKENFSIKLAQNYNNILRTLLNP